MITWIFEKDLFEEENTQMQEAISAFGYSFKEIEHVPFADTDWSYLFKEKTPTVFYGSLQLSKKLRPLCKGVYCDLPKFECTYYYPHLGEFLLNDKYIMLPFGELKRQKEFIFEKLSISNSLFVRPSSGFKLFTGQVINLETFDKDFDYLNFYEVDSHKVVVVASPKNIDKEWRLVIADKKVIASTLYKEGKNLVSVEGCPIEVKDYAEKIANVWEPERIWCMDICQYNNEIKLLEIGAFSSSGLYSCNKYDIVKKVSEIVIEEYCE